MSQQLQITGGAKVRDLQDVIIGTSGVLSSLAFNVANGVPKLDVNGKILVSQLPNSVMEYQGTWNAATNTPTLVNGTGNQGDVYLCNVAGTTNFGAGPITFAVGDSAIYSGTIWQRAGGATGTVTSVGLTSTGNDAITITGSPITTSGNINLGFAGTNLQYINGAGDLTTFPTLISSIGLTMPSAFSVANSPLTANGTIAVTGAGYPSQYIRGDGTLADFPTSGGGGSSVSYYLNGGTSQGTIGGVTYYEMSKTADTGTGVDFNKTGDGFIVAFLTDAGDPAQLNIPAGNWNYEIYASMSANGGTPEMYAELYKYDGTTFTLISTSSNEILYDGTNLNLYTFAMTVPSTTLAITDRLAIKLYATNSGGKTTTVHTQDSHLCQIITTFSTGITALNGLTAQVQYFATGTSGTDFNISSATATHTFNLPVASASNTGKLSSTDWSTFNGKVPYTGAIANVDLGLFSLKANGILAYGNGTAGGVVSFTQTGTLAGIATGVASIGSVSAGKLNIYFGDAGLEAAILDNSLLTADRTYNFPDASGTLALTSNLSSYVPYTGATGAVNLGAYDLTVNSVKIGEGGGSISGNTILGAGSLNANTTGYQNTAIGYATLNLNTTGYNNTSVGYAALNLNTTGFNNTAVGSRSLFSNTTGNSNTAIGYISLNTNTTGTFNTGVGYASLANNNGTQNTAIGYESLLLNTSGGANTAIGYQSLYSNTSGSGNIAIGLGTLGNNTTANYNIAIGFSALAANTTGTQNISIGYYGLLLNTTGVGNTAMGYAAMQYNTTGSYNTAIGVGTLPVNSTSSSNTAVGYAALGNCTGGANVAIGYAAGGGITSGGGNTLIYGGSSITTGSYNTIIGNYAGTSTMSNNIVLADGLGNIKYQWDGTSNNFDGILKSSGALWVNTSAGSPNSMIILAQVAGTQPPTLGNSSIGVNTTDFRFTATTTSTNFKSFSFSTSSLTNNSVRTYSMPDASGTLALTSDLGSYLPLTGGTLTGQLYINPTNTATVGLDVASDTIRFRSDNLEGFKRQLEITMGSGTLVQCVAKGYGGNYGTDLAFYTATTSGVNGTPAMYITGTNNRVGVKTGTPSYDLDVSGTFGVSSTSYFAGNIGVGVSSPTTITGINLIVKALSSPGNGYIQALSSDSACSVALYSGYDVTDDPAIIYQRSLRFGTSTNSAVTGYSEKMRITSDGYLRLATKGIQFNGDTSDSNSLDDYEEGSWTPTYGNSSTTPSYITQFGTYTKIGRVVNIVGKISASNLSGGAAIVIQGLPFAGANTVDAGQRVSLRAEGDWTGFNSLFSTTCFRINNSDFVGVRDSGGSSIYAIYSAYGGTLSFNFSATYYV